VLRERRDDKRIEKTLLGLFAPPASCTNSCFCSATIIQGHVRLAVTNFGNSALSLAELFHPWFHERHAGFL